MRTGLGSAALVAAVLCGGVLGCGVSGDDAAAAAPGDGDSGAVSLPHLKAVDAACDPPGSPPDDARPDDVIHASLADAGDELAADAQAADGDAAVDTGAGEGAAIADAGDGAADGDASAPGAQDALDADTVAHVQSVRSLGASLGRSPSIFAKAGDSITASPAFLADCDPGPVPLGDHASLADTLAYFGARTLPGGDSSLTRASLAAVPGWTSADALGPPDAVAAEIGAISPAYLVMMFGTNDAWITPPDQFRANMEQLVSSAESRGVVVVLSTIPSRVGAEALVGGLNDAILSLASARHLPLVDLFTALSALPGAGLGPDGVHPSQELSGNTPVCDVSAVGLAYGYNVRNLIVLEMLDRLRRLP